MRFMPDEPDETAAEEEDFARMLEESLQPTFLREGEPVEGKIVALGSDVAFVDVGGKGEATIDLAELADPDAGVEVQVGDTVKAIDPERKRMGIAIAEEGSAKATEAKGSELAPGARLIGKVKDHESYGVFVFLDAGNTGLIPLEETGVDKMASRSPKKARRRRQKRRVVSEVAAEILSIDPERKRMGIAIAEEGSAKATEAKASELAPGARLRGRRSQKSIGQDGPVGSDVEVIVLEVDPSNRRIRLSAKAVKEATEKGEARDYAKRQQAEKSESFGSLASTLRDAMKRREK